MASFFFCSEAFRRAEAFSFLGAWGSFRGLDLGFRGLGALLQQPGPKKFKLSEIELIYKAKKFKVPPFTV